jgi:HNH endonuclease
VPNCLFCRREFEKLTDEHVFPAAIGGNLIVRNATCPDCNNGISGKFEQYIARRFLHFRRLLSLKDRRGEIPVIEIALKVGDQERRASLLSDGSTVLRPRVTKLVQDGVAETTYESLPDADRENLRKKAKEQGWQFIEEATPGGEVEASFSGDLDFLMAEEMLRYVAKIAYTALALRMGLAIAQSDSFGEIREYINTGGGRPPVGLFLNEAFLAGSAQGLHQHSIVLAGRNDQRKVEAVVRIFGGLSYMVTLTDRYDGADFFDTLVYDSQRGEINPVLATNIQSEILQIEMLQADKATIWNDQMRAGKWFVNFVGREIERSQKRNA